MCEGDVWVAVGSLVAAGAANATELLDPLVIWRITRALSLYFLENGVGIVSGLCVTRALKYVPFSLLNNAH
jgi:hypothetical protein